MLHKFLFVLLTGHYDQLSSKKSVKIVLLRSSIQVYYGYTAGPAHGSGDTSFDQSTTYSYIPGMDITGGYLSIESDPGRYQGICSLAFVSTSSTTGALSQ